VDLIKALNRIWYDRIYSSPHPQGQI
jgi:hypothetical protein